MKKDLVLFDFDGTITRRDSLLEFIKFYRGSFSLITGFSFLLPWLLGLKLKLISNTKAKEKVLQYFFAGETFDTFQEKCDRFAAGVIPSICRKKALKEIEIHRKNHARIIVVSASPENWIQAWARQMEIELIGTKLESVNGIITGKINGENCYGEEKRHRILAELDPDQYGNIIAYGDSHGDREMLSLATRSFYRNFLS